ncbi:hypothetical protein [Runella sp.]|nr:hypothetical protein [Runella sp.]
MDYEAHPPRTWALAKPEAPAKDNFVGRGSYSLPTTKTIKMTHKQT